MKFKIGKETKREHIVEEGKAFACWSCRVLYGHGSKILLGQCYYCPVHKGEIFESSEKYWREHYELEEIKVNK